MPIQSDEFVDVLRREVGQKTYGQLKYIQDMLGKPDMRDAIKYAAEIAADKTLEMIAGLRVNCINV